MQSEYDLVCSIYSTVPNDYYMELLQCEKDGAISCKTMMSIDPQRFNIIHLVGN